MRTRSKPASSCAWAWRRVKSGSSSGVVCGLDSDPSLVWIIPMNSTGISASPVVLGPVVLAPVVLAPVVLAWVSVRDAARAERPAAVRMESSCGVCTRAQSTSL